MGYAFGGPVHFWSGPRCSPGRGATGQLMVVAAAALALQMVLPTIRSGCRLTGTDPAPTSANGAADAALPGVILPTLTTLVNIMDNRVLSLVNRVGVTAEIIGAALIAALLPTHSERSPGITFRTERAARSGLLGALLVGSFTADVRDHRLRQRGRDEREDPLPAPHRAPHDPHLTDGR